MTKLSDQNLVSQEAVIRAALARLPEDERIPLLRRLTYEEWLAERERAWAVEI